GTRRSGFRSARTTRRGISTRRWRRWGGLAADAISRRRRLPQSGGFRQSLRVPPLGAVVVRVLPFAPIEHAGAQGLEELGDLVGERARLARQAIRGRDDELRG